MSDLIPINVFISGRSYRIRIPAEDEARVRRAVKAADQKVTELRARYVGKDDQDFVAMCLLMYATDKGTSTDVNLLKDDLLALTEKIDKVLGSAS